MTIDPTTFPRAGAYGNDCPFCRTHNAILCKDLAARLYECRDCKRLFGSGGDRWTLVTLTSTAARETVQVRALTRVNETPNAAPEGRTMAAELKWTQKTVQMTELEHTPEALNSRILTSYTKETLEPLAVSIKNLGTPPVIWACTLTTNPKQLIILDGNRRYMANRMAGNPTIDVKMVEGLTPEQVASFSLALNLSAKSLTDYEQCRAVATLYQVHKLSLPAIGEQLKLLYGKGVDKALLSKMVDVWKRLIPDIREGDFKRAHPLATWRVMHEWVLNSKNQAEAWKTYCDTGGKPSKVGMQKTTKGKGKGKGKKGAAALRPLTASQMDGLAASIGAAMGAEPEAEESPEETAEGRGKAAHRELTVEDITPVEVTAQLRDVLLWVQRETVRYCRGARDTFPVPVPAEAAKA